MTISSARLKVASIVSALAIAAGALVASPAGAVAPIGGTVSGGMAGQVSPGSYTVMPNLRINFYPVTGSGELAGSAISAADGSFSLSGLPQGDYRIRYDAVDPASPMAPKWTGNNELEAASPIFTLGAADVNNLGHLLVNGGSISGHISGVSGGELGRATAYQFNPTTLQWERFPYSDVADGSGNYTIVGLPAGKYMVRFDEANDDPTGGEYLPTWGAAPTGLISVANETLVSGIDGTLSNDSSVVRLAGIDRFATSVAISQAGTWSDVAFVVNGLKFPDALSAGPAAASVGAPVLLVDQNSIPASVAAELDRLDLATIYVIGGSGTISTAVETQLAGYANTVERIGGVDRYATSREIASEFFTSSRTIYLATGSKFPDALGAGPAAANELGPVVLVDGATTELDDATVDLIAGLGTSRVIIAGGAGSVSAALEQELVDNLTEVYRRDGINRYDTSVKIAHGSYPAANAVFLASGAGFPDALAATGLAGNPSERAPIFLVEQNCVPAGVLDELDRLKPNTVYILGGPTTLGAGVENLTACP